jgi:hypothetical protein
LINELTVIKLKNRDSIKNFRFILEYFKNDRIRFQHF